LFLWATKARKAGMERYTFNYEVMKDENGGKQMKNVWRMMPPSSEEKKLAKHPTQKPVLLVARCLRASTNAGDLIVDPFAGSGILRPAATRVVPVHRAAALTERNLPGADLRRC
jgi:site-specific DNA-methyltransferase (adenine-specific)